MQWSSGNSFDTRHGLDAQSIPWVTVTHADDDEYGALAYRGEGTRDRSQLQELVIREEGGSGRLHDAADYDPPPIELSIMFLLQQFVASQPMTA